MPVSFRYQLTLVVVLLVGHALALLVGPVLIPLLLLGAGRHCANCSLHAMPQLELNAHVSLRRRFQTSATIQISRASTQKLLRWHDCSCQFDAFCCIVHATSQGGATPALLVKKYEWTAREGSAWRGPNLEGGEDLCGCKDGWGRSDRVLLLEVAAPVKVSDVAVGRREAGVGSLTGAWAQDVRKSPGAGARKLGR